MTYQALLFTLSAIGISETVYLIKKRLLLQKPICPVGEDCSVVLESKYHKIFGIPNDLLGLFFYVTCSILSSLLVLEVGTLSIWNTLFQIVIIIGSVMSVFFTYLQSQVIKAWCFWCIMSACTIWLMGAVLLINSFI